MKRLNNVVVKLWLTIILIVTTVLILLSAALITFFQYYFTQETENSLYKNAKNVHHVLQKNDNRKLAIEHSEALLEDNKGLIILPDRANMNQNDAIKQKMLKEISQGKNFERVLNENKPELYHVTFDIEGKTHTFMLLGYPSKGENQQASVIFIYQDLKSIDDTTHIITIIILITAVIFLAVTTVFAFFLSTRITHPLRQLKTQAKEVARGNYVKRVPIQTRDEIGELAMTFNKMSRSIQTHIDALTTSKNVRDTLINAMVEGVLGINHKREIIISNALAERMLESMGTAEREVFDRQVEDTFSSQKTEYREYEMHQRFYVIIMSHIDKIQTNGQGGLVVIVRDMTNEHELEQVKKDFIASVSHELRTPISLLQGYTESIVDGVVTDPDEINEFLTIVLDESKRLSRLVNELLNVAKIDAEGLNVTQEVQPMQELIKKMSSKYRLQAQELELNLDFQMDGEMTAPWYYDFDRMEQVLTNLVDNASRYTQPGDTISIQATANKDYQILTVEDTGVGIAPQHLQKLFERFYKVDSARKRGTQGSGLGLFITRMIVNAHGGHIEVKSKLGEGTQFTIQLPKKP
ncbi:ATP-binding protein [Staphylococcus lutrae]|uniref:Sensor protein SrrB n=1 Tax=Staphylococcus lutrae TaxID=155085 RepID=A0AAC9RT03_9STAP|nr:ATP-binding protein [Staphylococcus lutrae]ARJ51898.1 two-component sensor histidine kinase [Staphylococcus lutrae]PNZ35960.1 sensor histidine kinase [Staphylococcus lutrae]